MDDWQNLIDAPASILGRPIILLHAFGVTERTVLNSKDEAKISLLKGWSRYKMATPTPGPHERTDG